MKFTLSRLSVRAAILVLVGAMFAAFGGPASAATVPTSGTPAAGPQQKAVFFHIRAQHSGKCLDVQGGTGATGNGVPVQQWACLGPSQTNQQWRLVDTGDGVTYYIKALHSGKCLDVRGGTGATGNGVQVQQWACLGYAQSNQRWHINWLSGNYYRLRPAHATSKCLDVRGGTGATGNGVPVQQWACLGSGQLNQNWLFMSA